MGTYTTAVLGVHLMYYSDNGHSEELDEKRFAIKQKVYKLLEDAGISGAFCHFGHEMDSNLEAVAIGTLIRKIDFFSDSSVRHAVIPDLTDDQMKAINAAADVAEGMLLEFGGFDSFTKTVGLAVHGTS